MMNSKRFTIKFFIQEPETVSLASFIPVFHRWIQEKTVEGLLIDVADYKHIYNGPGVILLGAQVDYSIDLGKSQPGLLLRYKQPGPEKETLLAQLRTALLLALRACRALETDPDLNNQVAFRTDEVEIAFQDRLMAPNTAETFVRYSPELRQILSLLYAGHSPELTLAAQDPRAAFAIRAHVPNAPSLSFLIKNLEDTSVPIEAGGMQ